MGYEDSSDRHDADRLTSRVVEVSLAVRDRRDGSVGGPRRIRRDVTQQTLFVDEFIITTRVWQGLYVMRAVNRFSRSVVAGWVLELSLARDLNREFNGGIMGKFVGKVKAAKEAKKKGVGARDVTMAKSFPALHEFLTEMVNDDKTPRQTASLSVFTQDGYFKVCLTDRETNMCLFATSEGFQDALEALEAELQSPAPDWRESKYSKGKK